MRLTTTTGLRAAIGGCVAALLVVLATPTAAVASEITVTGSAVTVGEQPGTSSVTVAPMDPRPARNVKVSVAATGDAANYVDVKVTGGSCKGGGTSVNCGRMRLGDTKDFTVEVSLKSGSGLKNGESKTGALEFKVEGPNSGGGSASLTVTGFEQVAKVIKGKVADLDDKPIEGAKFTAKDYGSATTNAQGEFSIDAEVEPNSTIEWEVTKKGFVKLSDSYPVAPGVAIDIQPRMSKKGEEKSAAPEDDGEQAKEDTGDDGGFTFTTWVLIILGVLLAIGGVFAIWMLLRKGKEDDDDAETKLPDEPLTHQASASQTGKFGVYEGSGIRPGADNPTMLHNGPLYRDDDLSRYGSAEPASAAGFGPAYSDAGTTRSMASGGDPAASTQRYQAAEPTSGSWGSNEPVSGSTQRYPAAEPNSGSWGANQQAPGSTQRYPAAEPNSGSWGANQPTSGSAQPYRSAEPTSGAWGANQPTSGSAQSYRAAEPTSGAWGSNQPTSGSAQPYRAAEPNSGSWGANQPTSGSAQPYRAAEPASGSWGSREPGSGSWQSNQPTSDAGGRYGAEPASGSWQSNQPTSGSTQRYPAADPGAGRHPGGDGYGPGYDDRGAAAQQPYRQPEQPGGYGEQPPRQAPGRHYRDDDYGDYDDRPRSW